MVTKSITIDAEAYDRLEKARRANESFGVVIKRFLPKPLVPMTAAECEAWLASIASDPFSEEFVQAVEEQVAGRKRRSRRRR